MVAARTLVFALALLAACAPPLPVPGGGVRGDFDSVVHVTVIDEADGAVIEGATVLVDGVEQGQTDAHGQLSVTIAAADRVEARAPGRVTTAFLGAGASVQTIPLALSGLSMTALHAEVAGYADLQPPAGTTVRATIGRVVDSIDEVGPPLVVCEGGTECRFDGPVPAGRVQLFAQIDAVDPGPTDDPADDIVTPLSFGLSDALQLAPGLITDLRVERFRDEALVEVEVIPASADGFDEVVGVPGIRLGEGVIVFFDRPGGGRFLLPRTEGALATASFWAITRARSAAGESITVARQRPGAIDPRPVGPPAPPLPTLTAGSGGYVIGGVERALIYELRSEDERVVVFDGRDQIASTDEDASLVLWEAPPPEHELDLAQVERTFTRRAITR